LKTNHDDSPNTKMFPDGTFMPSQTGDSCRKYAGSNACYDYHGLRITPMTPWTKLNPRSCAHKLPLATGRSSQRHERPREHSESAQEEDPGRMGFRGAR
jgi:hypothetical protein